MYFLCSTKREHNVEFDSIEFDDINNMQQELNNLQKNKITIVTDRKSLKKNHTPNTIKPKSITDTKAKNYEEKMLDLEKQFIDDEDNQKLRPAKITGDMDKTFKKGIKKIKNENLLNILFIQDLKHQINHTQCLVDRCSWGLITLISQSFQYNNKKFIPIFEWVFKYGPGICFNLCCNINQDDLFLENKFSYGLKLFIFAIGIGDGFFLSYLNSEILDVISELFDLKVIFGNFAKFFEKDFNVGVVLNFLNNFFVSLTFNTSNDYLFNKKTNEEKGVGVYIHFDNNFIFFALYFILINFKISLDLCFLSKSIIISTFFNKTNKELYLCVDIFRFINSFAKVDKIFHFINSRLSVLITFFFSEIDKKTFMFLFVVKLGKISIMISYDKQNKFSLTVFCKIIETNSVIGLLKQQDQMMSYGY